MRSGRATMRRSLFLLASGATFCTAHSNAETDSSPQRLADMAVMFPARDISSQQTGIAAISAVVDGLGLNSKFSQANRQLEFDLLVDSADRAAANPDDVCSFLNEAATDFANVQCSVETGDAGHATLSLEIQNRNDDAVEWKSDDIQSLLWRYAENKNWVVPVSDDIVVELSVLSTDAVRAEGFQSLLALGQLEDMFQTAVAAAVEGVDEESVLAVVLETNKYSVAQQSDSSSRGHHQDVSGQDLRRAVEKSAPVYRALEGGGHDPYCADPYLDPYNPYCAFCELNDLEDSLPEGYVIVDAETNNYHPAGGLLSQDSGASVGCADGYTATFGNNPTEVNCTLTPESDGDGYEDRSSPFVFVSHPTSGGGLTCFPTDQLPMQVCDTNPTTVERNARTTTPGLIDVGDNITIICLPGFTDPVLPVDREVLECLAAPSPLEAAQFEDGELRCLDIDDLCVLEPYKCTTLGDRDLTFEECDTMLEGGALVDEFNAAFLDFLGAFLGFAIVPPPELSPTCGSIILNSYFDTPEQAQAFRQALKNAFAASGSDVLTFTFNGVEMNFTLEDLLATTAEPETTVAAATTVAQVTDATGATGAANATAVTAATGVTDATGATGVTDATGATGVTDGTGATGATGVTDGTGATGVTDGTGATGVTDGTGPTETDSNGFSGTTGSVITGGNTGSGTDATPATDGATTVVAVSTAAAVTTPPPTTAEGTPAPSPGSGTTGEPVTGVTGATGVTDATGGTGVTDETGATGVTDATGGTGATGVTDATGATGVTDATGGTGVTDATGATGVTDETGATGVTDETGATGVTDATGATGVTDTTLPSDTTAQPEATVPPEESRIVPGLDNWAFGLIIAIVILVFIVIIVIIVLAATGAFKKKEEEEEEEDPEAEEPPEDDEDDGDFSMQTAAAQALVSQIVTDQVPKEMSSYDEDSTADEASELGVNGESSTGAAQLISSIISAIDDVEPVADMETTETDAEPTTTTAATDALISEVLAEPSTADEESRSMVSASTDDVTVESSNASTQNRDEAYE